MAMAHVRADDEGEKREKRRCSHESKSKLCDAHAQRHARQMANSCLQIASISAPCRGPRLQFPFFFKTAERERKRAAIVTRARPIKVPVAKIIPNFGEFDPMNIVFKTFFQRKNSGPLLSSNDN